MRIIIKYPKKERCAFRVSCIEICALRQATLACGIDKILAYLSIWRHDGHWQALDPGPERFVWGSFI
ncbi:MAG TPA: hypothetical protein DCR25_00895 [Rhodobacter sp.]|nr:hypothetical protein [Rhodobacter sp.]